jgi:hypothetical protein
VETHYGAAGGLAVQGGQQHHAVRRHQVGVVNLDRASRIVAALEAL